MTSENPQSMTAYPFQLLSDVGRFEVAENISVEPLDDDFRERHMGIRDVVVDENGHLNSLRTTGFEYASHLVGPQLDMYDRLFSSNYIVRVPSREHAVNFNLALKLLGVSCTSIYAGFNDDKTISYVSPPSYYGRRPLHFGEESIEQLRTMVAAVQARAEDQKFSVMSQVFRYAMSSDLRPQTRFLELCIVLEMILLPKISVELAYRFALRFAHVLAPIANKPKSECYEAGKLIYSVRSKLVHEGAAKKFNEAEAEILEVSRAILTAYVANPEIFTSERLDQLCLE